MLTFFTKCLNIFWKRILLHKFFLFQDILLKKINFLGSVSRIRIRMENLGDVDPDPYNNPYGSTSLIAIYCSWYFLTK